MIKCTVPRGARFRLQISWFILGTSFPGKLKSLAINRKPMSSLALQNHWARHLVLTNSRGRRRDKQNFHWQSRLQRGLRNFQANNRHARFSVLDKNRNFYDDLSSSKRCFNRFISEVIKSISSRMGSSPDPEFYVSSWTSEIVSCRAVFHSGSIRARSDARSFRPRTIQILCWNNGTVARGPRDRAKFGSEVKLTAKECGKNR